MRISYITIEYKTIIIQSKSEITNLRTFANQYIQRNFRDSWGPYHAYVLNVEGIEKFTDISGKWNCMDKAVPSAPFQSEDVMFWS